MSSLASSLSAITDLSNQFDGHISLKNMQGKYFFVNEKWLQSTKLTREQVLGKANEEIFSPEVAAVIDKSDKEALESNSYIEYTGINRLSGENEVYHAIKCVVKYDNGEPFCLCNVAHYEQEKLNSIREKILEIFSPLKSSTKV